MALLLKKSFWYKIHMCFDNMSVCMRLQYGGATWQFEDLWTWNLLNGLSLLSGTEQV